MLIDMNAMEEKNIEHFKGGEKSLAAKMFNDDSNRIIHGRLVPGATIGLHTHDTSSEIVYILEGRGKMIFDDTVEELCAGQCHYCPKGHTHSLVNNSDADLAFFAVVPEQ